jgi:16S rRNA (cytosine1402-N4)-methyltransferase
MPPDRDDLSQLHRPVLVAETLRQLHTEPLPQGGFLLVDGTVGAGGHAEAALEAAPRARLLGLDRDPDAVRIAERRLARFGARARVRAASYADLGEVLDAEGEEAPRGVLLDLGVSSMQLDDPARGFSFRAEDALPDMRFDPSGPGPTAAELLDGADEEEIARVLREHGGEARARAVARAIVRARPILTVGRLCEAVRRAALRRGRIDPATRTFQALRIWVNDELGHLERGLEAAIARAAPGGRVVVIAFHSGEERAVKAAFRGAARRGAGRVVTRKPVRPTEEEVRRNPRARPARLRAFEVGVVEGRRSEEG